MSRILADTHAILWFLFEPARLSSPALQGLNGVANSAGVVLVSAISIVEARYLVEKFRIPSSFASGLLTAISDPGTAIDVVAVDLAVAQAVDQIPRNIVPDFPDRIISATALVHGIPLVTADAKIQAAPIVTIW